MGYVLQSTTVMCFLVEPLFLGNKIGITILFAKISVEYLSPHELTF